MGEGQRTSCDPLGVLVRHGTFGEKAKTVFGGRQLRIHTGPHAAFRDITDENLAG